MSDPGLAMYHREGPCGRGAEGWKEDAACASLPMVHQTAASPAGRQSRLLGPRAAADTW